MIVNKLNHDSLDYNAEHGELGIVDDSWKTVPNAMMWRKDEVENVGPWWISPNPVCLCFYDDLLTWFF